jgi:hypothetical protein
VIVNQALIWDYEFSPEDIKTDSFRRWYVARVLARGGAEDIRAVGIETIERELPHLNLHPVIRSFWTWYFGERHG